MHLARVFRFHDGTPAGACLRGLRMTWAAGSLTASDDGIARWQVVVLEQDRRELVLHVPGDVVGEQVGKPADANPIAAAGRPPFC